MTDRKESSLEFREKSIAWLLSLRRLYRRQKMLSLFLWVSVLFMSAVALLALLFSFRVDQLLSLLICFLLVLLGSGFLWRTFLARWQEEGELLFFARTLEAVDPLFEGRLLVTVEDSSGAQYIH